MRGLERRVYSQDAPELGTQRVFASGLEVETDGVRYQVARGDDVVSVYDLLTPQEPVRPEWLGNAGGASIFRVFSFRASPYP